VKCSASGAHSEDMCGAQCTPSKEEGKEDKVLPEDISLPTRPDDMGADT
jgi:hypothetical protein